jgi:hypothetical protein
MKGKWIAAFCGVAVGLAISVAWAQTESFMVKERSQGEVKYLVGGVGKEERDYMNSLASNYNLKLVFAVASREYLSDVRVVVQDTNGKTYLNTTADGPWVMAKLPEGEYIIQATVGGETLVQKRKVGKGLELVYFHWKQ